MATAQVSRLLKLVSTTTDATVQSKMILNDSNGLKKSKGTGRIAIMNHEDMEHYLGRYAGLMLYLKEMDENIYGKLCAVRIQLYVCDTRYFI